MNVLLINSVCGIGSTGRICGEIAEAYEKEGHNVKIAFGRDATVTEQCKRFAVRIGGDLDVKIAAMRTRVLDDHGFASKAATQKFLQWADSFNPEVLWLHNLHGYYINVEMLFAWIKSRPWMKVKWTLHDCWAFTGHCVHFMVAKCDKWKYGCSNCPEKKVYPSSYLLDNSKHNYMRKKAAFCGVSDMTIIVPSFWLGDLVKQSFLKEYPVEVQYNKIDRSVFKPTPSEVKAELGLGDKKIILGVASVWTDRKGLGDFIELAKRIPEDQVILLVGLDKNKVENLPVNVIGVPRTNSAAELAKLYSIADVFVNPSREETFGMTTVEARACGVQAIVYKGTACEEIVEKYGGVAIEPDIDQLYDRIQLILRTEQ